MFALSIATCSVLVSRVVAKLRGTVRTLMVFAQSMRISDNIFAVNLHKEKMMHVIPNCDSKMRKRAGYYLCSRGEAGIYWTPMVGGWVAEYWWLTL